MEPSQKSKVLFIGAHPDDVELNCLGTILKWQKNYNIETHILICAAVKEPNPSIDRKQEQRNVASKYSATSVTIGDNKIGDLIHNAKLVREIEQVIIQIKPDFVFVHGAIDHHQDHVAVSLATVSALRKFEINLIFYPSITALLHPVKSNDHNLLVDITSEIDEKINIVQQFKSQESKYYFSKDFITQAHRYIDSQSRERFFEKFNVGYIVK